MIYNSKKFDNGFLAQVIIDGLDRDVLTEDKINKWLSKHTKDFLIDDNTIYFKEQVYALLFINHLSIYSEPILYNDYFNNVFTHIDYSKIDRLEEQNLIDVFSYYDVEFVEPENGIPYPLDKDESYQLLLDKGLV